MAHSHLIAGAVSNASAPVIRKIGLADLKEALSRGTDDFLAMPTHAIFLCVVYPLIGLVAARLAFGYSVLPLLYPIATGFALVGPLAAIGLYELSRRREQGLDASFGHVFDVLRSSSLGAIIALGLLLVVIFAVWVTAANAIYTAYFGYKPPVSIPAFVSDVLTTEAGWSLIIVGNAVGFVFAAVALTLGAVSFPLLLDRDIGAAGALLTSIRAVAANPLVMAAWGIIVAALLLIGSLPFFIGLTVVLPILGHSTWHLYRKLVVAEGSPKPTYRSEDRVRRPAADFPAALFPWRK